MVALVLLSSLLLIACGKKEDDYTPPAQTETETPEPAPIPVPEPEATPEPEPDPTPEPEPAPAPVFDIETDRHDAIYNHDLVKAVYLGMTRAELEAMFAPLEESQNGYTPYDDYNFFIEYWGNDTVRIIIVYERDAWETFNGITFGSTVSQVTAAYGEPLATDNDVYTYYTYENEILSEAPSLAEVDVNYLYSIGFITEDGAVVGVTLSRF